MGHNVRSFFSPGKLIGLLVLVTIVGLASGSEAGTSVSAAAIILIAFVAVWWLVSRIFLWIRGRRRRGAESKRVEGLASEQPPCLSLPHLSLARPQTTQSLLHWCLLLLHKHRQFIGHHPRSSGPFTLRA